MQRLQPDVVALQEVTRTAGYDQVLDLLGPSYHVLGHPGSSTEGVGPCLVSRWPLRSAAVVDLHVMPGTVELPWAAAVVVEVFVPAPLGPLLVVHHTPSGRVGAEQVREQQAVATALAVEDLVAGRELPVVLVGDFGAAAEAASVRFFTGRQSLSGTGVRYQDAWEAAHPGERGHTFSPLDRLVGQGETPLERGRRAEYVMVRCGPREPVLNVAGCELAFDQPAGDLWPSDHFGVVADLEMPARQLGHGADETRRRAG